MSSTSMITYTHFRREDDTVYDLLLTPARGYPWKAFEASFAVQRVCFPFFGCLRELIVVEGEYKQCSAKLEKGWKTMDNIVPMA